VGDTITRAARNIHSVLAGAGAGSVHLVLLTTYGKLGRSTFVSDGYIDYDVARFRLIPKRLAVSRPGHGPAQHDLRLLV
jgi:hypothetical protein